MRLRFILESQKIRPTILYVLLRPRSNRYDHTIAKPEPEREFLYQRIAKPHVCGI